MLIMVDLIISSVLCHVRDLVDQVSSVIKPDCGRCLPDPNLL